VRFQAPPGPAPTHASSLWRVPDACPRWSIWDPASPSKTGRPRWKKTRFHLGSQMPEVHLGCEQRRLPPSRYLFFSPVFFGAAPELRRRLVTERVPELNRAQDVGATGPRWGATSGASRSVPGRGITSRQGGRAVDNRHAAARTVPLLRQQLGHSNRQPRRVPRAGLPAVRMHQSSRTAILQRLRGQPKRLERRASRLSRYAVEEKN